jgi:hypothetical protein
MNSLVAMGDESTDRKDLSPVQILTNCFHITIVFYLSVDKKIPKG